MRLSNALFFVAVSPVMKLLCQEEACQGKSLSSELEECLSALW